MELAAARAANLLVLVPLIPALGRHQAAMGTQALAPHRLAGGFFAAGIEGHGWRLGIFPPGRNQAPAGGHHFQFARFVQAQHGYDTGRGHIEALDPAAGVPRAYVPVVFDGAIRWADVATAHGRFLWLILSA
ncbi:hypothetical protein D3C85_993340 [compost metagenome]